jgi:hypothetical protein
MLICLSSIFCDGGRNLVEEPAVVPRILVEQEFREQRIGRVLDGDHDRDGTVVLGDDDGFPPRGVEELAESGLSRKRISISTSAPRAVW